MPPVIYSIPKFEQMHSNAELAKKMHWYWVRFPTSLDSLSLRRLLKTRPGIQAVGVYTILVEIAANGSPRGTLTRSNGEPLSAQDLCDLTGMPHDAVIEALTLLASDGIRWMSARPLDSVNVDPTPGSVNAAADAVASTTDPTPTPVDAASIPIDLNRRAVDSSLHISSNSESDSGSGSSSPKPTQKKRADDASHADPPIPPELDTPEFLAKWEEWHAYRRERRLPPWLNRTRTAKLKELAAYGHATAIAAIDNSIGNGYQGIVVPGPAGPQGQTPASRANQRRAEQRGREFAEDLHAKHF